MVDVAKEDLFIESNGFKYFYDKSAAKVYVKDIDDANTIEIQPDELQDVIMMLSTIRARISAETP